MSRLRLFAIESKVPMLISAPRQLLRRSTEARNVVITGRSTDTGLTLATDDSRVRVGGRRLGQDFHRERSPGTSSNVARSVPAETASTNGRAFPTWPTWDFRLPKRRPMAPSSSRSTKAPAAA